MHFSLWVFAFLKFIGFNRVDNDNTSLDRAIYNGCGTDKFCVGFPHHCIETKSCKEFAATFKKGEIKSKNYENI